MDCTDLKGQFILDILISLHHLNVKLSSLSIINYKIQSDYANSISINVYVQYRQSIVNKTSNDQEIIYIQFEKKLYGRCYGINKYKIQNNKYIAIMKKKNCNIWIMMIFNYIDQGSS